MKLTEIDMQGGFRVLAGTARSQAATMVLSPGQSTGGPDNRHPQSDQWLFVILGRGKAQVESEERDLVEGSLLLIEAGEAHEIRNDGDRLLEILSFYALQHACFAGFQHARPFRASLVSTPPSLRSAASQHFSLFCSGGSLGFLPG